MIGGITCLFLMFGPLAGSADEGLRLSGREVRFPEPTIREGESAARQRAALEKVCGSKAKADDLLRDSISAPFVLKTEDLEGDNGDVVRVAHLWFAVRADFDELDPELFAPGESKPVEAANMRFSGAVVKDEELKARGIEPPAEPKGGLKSWFVHSTGDLLDRIHVESTSKVEASRTDHALTVAARPGKGFQSEGPARSFWRNAKAGGDVQAYDGGGGYVKVSKYEPEPGVLIVEAHVAFSEPHGWFEGRPILRSKIGLVAQEQIRGLRRELQKK